MNKKMIAILAGTVVLPVTLSGCSEGSGKKYSYEVSGIVKAAQVDYECDEDVALEYSAFALGGTKPKPKKKADSDRGSTRGSAQEGSATRSAPTPASPKKRPPASKAPISKSPRKSSGVKLSKKPDKPERVTKIEPPKYMHKPKGCHEEYELFIQNREGLFEQDVREVDYDNCLDKAHERFPACTKN